MKVEKVEAYICQLYAWYEHEEIPSGGLGGWDNRQKPEQKKKKMVDANK